MTRELTSILEGELGWWLVLTRIWKSRRTLEEIPGMCMYIVLLIYVWRETLQMMKREPEGAVSAGITVPPRLVVRSLELRHSNSLGCTTPYPVSCPCTVCPWHNLLSARSLISIRYVWSLSKSGALVVVPTAAVYFTLGIPTWLPWVQVVISLHIYVFGLLLIDVFWLPFQ